MKISLENSTNTYLIHGYSSGEIRISMPGAGENISVARRSLVISPGRVVQDWPPQSLQEIEPSHLEAVRMLGPEVLLLGTGPRMQFPEPSLYAAMVQLGVGFEVMDTAAACRTYNVLVSEGRSVAAALLIA